MPQIGHRVRVTFKNGKTLEGKLIDIYMTNFYYAHAIIRLDNGKIVNIKINDVSEGVESFEDLEM